MSLFALTIAGSAQIKYYCCCAKFVHVGLRRVTAGLDLDREVVIV
jgi:hypothetical protein